MLKHLNKESGFIYDLGAFLLMVVRLLLCFWHHVCFLGPKKEGAREGNKGFSSSGFLNFGASVMWDS